MTNQQHPLTPPPELVQKLIGQAFGTLGHSDFADPVKLSAGLTVFATCAAQWGADQELKACCVELAKYCDCGVELTSGRVRELLMELRRPKPPSLAEEALVAQQRLWDGKSTHDDWNLIDWHLIRRALERLKSLEDE